MSFSGGFFERLSFVFKSDLRKSNFGRLEGWYVELDGNIIGELIDYKSEDMFWDSYKFIPKDNFSLEVASRKELWDSCRFQFKTKKDSLYAKNAFSANGLEASGRVSMRGLYIR